MTLATKHNDNIALGQTTGETQTSRPLTEAELSVILGGQFEASDAAFVAQQDAQQQFDNARNNTFEALGNLDLGSATRSANEAYNAYGNLQTANENLQRAVDSDVAEMERQHDIDTQISNGHNYSPTDANMSNSDGSPGVGY